MEYQEGHLDQHFRVSGELDTDTVVRSFISYSDGEDGWRNELKRERYDF